MAVPPSSVCLILLLAGSLLVDAEMVTYEASNDANSTQGGQRFDSVLGLDGAVSILADSTEFIKSVFDYSSPETPQKHVELIKFTLEDIGGVAFTSGDEIHLSASYVGNYSGDVVGEIRGVLYHEMTHVWQWDGRGSAPGGVIEGVADYVRLKAGLGPSHWVKPGQGSRWDQGYDVTARFFDYLTGLKPGFVAQLNSKLAGGWSEDYFNALLGKSVQQLWSDYKRSYNMSG